MDILHGIFYLAATGSSTLVQILDFCKSFLNPLIVAGAAVIAASVQARTSMRQQQEQFDQQQKIRDQEKKEEKNREQHDLLQKYLTLQGAVFDVANKLIYRLKYYSDTHPKVVNHTEFAVDRLDEKRPGSTPREYVVFLLFRMLGVFHRYDLQEDGLPGHESHDSFMFMWDKKLISALASPKLPSQKYLERNVLDEVSTMVGEKLESGGFSWITFCQMIRDDETFAWWVKECTEHMTSGFGSKVLGIQMATRARLGILLIFLIDLIQDLTGKPQYEEIRAQVIERNLGQYWDQSTEEHKKWFLYKPQDMDWADRWPSNDKSFHHIQRSGSRFHRQNGRSQEHDDLF